MSGRTLAIVIAVLILIVGLVVAVMFLPTIRGMFSEKGALIIKLTDAPVELKHLNVTISSLSALRVERIFNFPREETWEDLWFVDDASQVNVDVLALQNETKDLSTTEIPSGSYTKLRMTITKATATFIDGETMELTVPTEHIDVIIEFEIEPGETTTLLVDMEADWVAISQAGRLRPVLKATVMEHQ